MCSLDQAGQTEQGCDLLQVWCITVDAMQGQRMCSLDQAGQTEQGCDLLQG